MRFHLHCSCRITVWPDWVIFGTLGKNSKPVAKIILHKSPTLLGKFCKGAKIIHFSSEIIFGQLLLTFVDFYLVTLLQIHLLRGEKLFRDQFACVAHRGSLERCIHNFSFINGLAYFDVKNIECSSKEKYFFSINSCQIWIKSFLWAGQAFTH